MPLNKSQIKSQLKVSAIYCLIIVIISLISWQIYHYWGTWLQLSVDWQRQLNQGLAALLQQTASKPLYAGSMLVTVSFLYGLLHALGPGHGKLIITTYIATQAPQLKQSVIMSLLASLLQGIVAILLVSLILILFQLSTKHLNLASLYAEQFSYLLVILLGIFLCVSAIQLWVRNKRRASFRLQKIQHIRPLTQHASLIVNRVSLSSQARCACGHQHIVPAQDLKQNTKAKVLIILSMGMRPCSGALLVLLFSYVIDAYIWGIIAALAMAIGTALTICFIAIFVHFMRNSALHIAQLRGIQLHQNWKVSLKIITGLLFILMGALMYQSALISQSTSPFMS